MKRRSGANSDAEVPVTIHAESSASDPVDIFAGLQRQDLHSQSPPAAKSSDSKTDNSARVSGSSAAQTASQPQLPLNRLLAKYPRLFWYAAIAILGIIIGILLGRT